MCEIEADNLWIACVWCQRAGCLVDGVFYSGSRQSRRLQSVPLYGTVRFASAVIVSRGKKPASRLSTFSCSALICGSCQVTGSYPLETGSGQSTGRTIGSLPNTSSDTLTSFL